MLTYFPMLVPPILFTSLLFGKEFEDRTIMYTFIRPINYRKLFLSKIAAAYLYSLFIACLFFIVTSIYGMIFFSITPFEFDNSILQSSFRCLVLFLYTCIGMLLVISICSIINMYSLKMFGSVIFTSILWIVLSVIVVNVNFNGDAFRIPFTTYLNPVEYYEQLMSTFLIRCIGVTVINCIVIFLELFCAYKRALKFRKGLKMYN